MNLKIAQALVLNELNKHNLNEYTFEFSRAKRTKGQCWYIQKVIKLSKSYVELNSFQVVYNTILHEIAHALTYKKYNVLGHNRIWKKVCYEIGCNGERINKDAINEYNYFYKCQKCGHIIGTYRKLKNVGNKFHKNCGSEGRIIKVEREG